jgi:hypothetical protein
MKRWQILAGLGVALGVVGGVAIARQMPSAATIAQVNLEAGNDAHQAIAKVYDPIHAKTDFFAKRVVNGVNVYDVDVKTSEGEATAVVTESGDYLEQGLPINLQTAPPGVQNIAHNLMRGASGVSKVDRTVYFVNLQAGTAEYELQFDATGTIHDMRPMGERVFETPAKMPAASESAKEGITKRVAAMLPGAQVTDVRVADATAGFYFASFNINGGYGWVDLNLNGQFVQVVRPADVDKLPALVTQTINKFFKADKILTAHVGTICVFDLEENSGKDDLILHIQADGIVESVSNYTN